MYLITLYINTVHFCKLIFGFKIAVKIQRVMEKTQNSFKNSRKEKQILSKNHEKIRLYL